VPTPRLTGSAQRGSTSDGTRGGGYPRNRVAAAAAIVAEIAGDGGTRLPVLRSQVPLVLRRTPEAVYLVGGAAGPIGGDCLNLRIEVRDGAALAVRTAAAAIALPGLDGLESVLTVTATVGAGASLEYLPEPVVVAAGARHATDIRVTLAEGASLLLRDELILGRHGEPGGSARTVLRVDYAGRPLLRQSLEINGADAASLGPAILAGHRAVGSLLMAGPSVVAADPRGEPGLVAGAGAAGAGAAGAGPAGAGPAGAGPAVAVMRLAGPGILVTALADDAVSLRRRLGNARGAQSTATSPRKNCM
jgi:urease accessory protein